MQVYRGMDIGTAKPSPADRARVPHHLIDVVEVTEPFDAAQFVQLARRAVADIQSRGRVPILCGGTGLYFKAFLEGLGEAPPADAALRAVLEATPLPELLRELAERDPATYERIDRQNPRRVIRAIEVIRLTGKPFSAQRADWDSRTTHHASRRHAASASRAPRRICTSVSAPALTPCSAGAGWPKPSNSCSAAWPRTETAMQALGYRQIVEHLRGERSLAETIELVKMRTRQFAKRQMTWFRRQLQLTWINLEPQSSAEAVAESIARL